MHGDLDMQSHNIHNVTQMSGYNGLLNIDNGNQLHVQGYGNLNNCKVQGSYLDWNDGAGGGKMNLICNRGTGGGGFSFYNVGNDASGNVASSTTNEIIDIDGAGDMILYSTTASTSSSTGALVVKGGAGIAKDLYVAGNIHCTGTVNSADTNLYQEFHAIAGGGSASDFSGTITLNGGGQNTTNYAVFTSIYDNFPGGSGGTYNSSQTSSALNQVIISNITKTSFDFMLNKNTGNNVNLNLVFMVIFSSELNYPKSC